MNPLEAGTYGDGRRKLFPVVGREVGGKPAPAQISSLLACLFVLILILFPLLVNAEEAAPEKEAAVSEATPEKEAAVSEATPEKSEGEQEEFVEEKGIADPLEKWNRAMFTVNDRLYFWVLKPAAKGYNAVVPEWGRVRVRNIFRNAATPIRFVNCILQLKLHDAAKEVGRFLVNTTAGIGGMFDLLKDNPNAQMSDRDLGQTFGKYGIGDGFYIIWPFLGPSSLRDSAGLAGDGFLDPVNYLPLWEEVIAVDAPSR